MAQLIAVPIYRINSNQIVPGTTYGLSFGQMQSVQPVTGGPFTVNGNYVYTVINMAGTVQNPGPSYYTNISVATIIAGS